MQPPLIITSMHRSGSSAVTGLLQTAGLHIGTRLMEANFANIRGYFENLSFYQFHQAALSSLKNNPNGYSLHSFPALLEPWTTRARELLQQEQQAGPWGWKDPRSVLFLNFWRELCPDARYVFLFRNPWCVVDSLYRRGDDFFRNQPEYALACLSYYNRELLAFCQTLPDRCLLAKVEWVFENPSGFVDAVVRKLGIKLGAVSEAPIETGLYRHESELSFYAHMLEEHAPEALNLYQELLDASDHELLGRDRGAEANPALDSDPQELRKYFFQDWFEKRELKRNYEAIIAAETNKTVGAAGAEDTLARMNEYGRELESLLSRFKKPY